MLATDPGGVCDFLLAESLGLTEGGQPLSQNNRELSLDGGFGHLNEASEG